MSRKRNPKLQIKLAPAEAPPINVPANLDTRTTITIGEHMFDVEADDLEKICDLGHGAYGYVEKMKHKPSGTIMAVKRITATVNSQEQKRLLMDLDISMRSSDCPYTVQFYGALFREGDVWICMEVMDTSLDKFYAKVYKHGRKIPEDILGKISLAVVSALHYLHSQLKVIHRDVKPSNILINRRGEVKMCDFGISGYLVDSIAKTIDAGCKPYMAPERIDPQGNPSQYDIRSDVWSLGISLIELATGAFPYPNWGTPFEQLKQVVNESPPRLPSDEYTPDFEDFTTQCLQKQYQSRYNYDQLLNHRFCLIHREKTTDVAAYVSEILDLPDNP
ncbi:PREDICTED: dual specificity mitogen-activated protein kinase kinase 6 [Nicrophorus vespilloides]|uniref:mitogen-activated protein kinase kinase n=1 Tax=Nicrophorus vespilloides TaxID=110193 RepID=A0ABM1MBR5_NICVS|nr:PREDICTED: dual specificity mitogen-activated protein kinase kinase 6 [Nicrophorus vespilloides]XP_017772012.1 PREDICTED: dual specificity mitogen-activated protein kinase kinase 6 [Nicrophorus vespilloides]XP_017772013.1 PREDICTED: dual specificity mitogen-activated protein kinase kinase 6 [Nicrophorus vespilloides]XP_017772014.1 PREDICTED: dual specificity mitogen-activated protein kinase kinase 6 [Nicrophorus vespilloides]XP_017772015.1 PREDICTED: dual specificity mitogen-activated protei